MERTNLRDLERLPEPIDLATLDLSFISLRLVMPAVRNLMAGAGLVIVLVKPQFEAGREAVPRGGVVRDPETHRAVLLRFGEDAAAAGFATRALIGSPIHGADGNREFLALLATGADPQPAWAARVERLLASPV
jgi:23S rRNA (cytidine1920-2'-O)/16S rRNA (cytidine1409-2'-O)-methyltransferase